MTRALPFTQTAIKRAMEGVKAGGERVTAVEIRPDGTIRVLTTEATLDAIEAGKGGTGWEDFLDDAA